jgi:hypothetical protein
MMRKCKLNTIILAQVAVRIGFFFLPRLLVNLS